MAVILGTPLADATDDDRLRTLLVSDLHIPADGGPALEWFRALLADAAQQPGCRVVVLGDLFDAYTGPKQAHTGVWKATADALAAAARAGVSLTLLHGNRDFMLDDRFAALAGCRVVAGGLRLQLAGRRATLLHGDELCTRDLPYQRAKRLLRHPLTRGLLRRLPLAVALQLAERARRRSATVIAGGDQDRFDPSAAAVAAVFASGAELLVFGHIHRPARGRFPDAGAPTEYVILPAFDEAGVFLEAGAGRLFYRRVDGSELPDYPPREFC